MAHEIDIVLDLTKQRAKIPRFVMQREVDAKQLNFSIIDNGVNVDITSKTLTLCMEKPDGQIIYNTITISDGTAGECYIVLTSPCQAAVGTAKCWVKIVDGASVTYSPKFELEIMEVTDFATTVESTSEFTDLDADIAQIAGFEARIGDQTYTEQNYITDDESITNSLDVLDMQAKDNADDITTIKGVGWASEKLTHIGLLASLLTTAKTNLVAAINELFTNAVGYTLFTGPSSAAITLSETAANFVAIEVAYHTNDNQYFVQKIYAPNGKSTTLATYFYSAGVIYFKEVPISFSGTALTRGTVYYVGTSAITSVTAGADNVFVIDKVVGYK
jgi:hypothetical protein